MNDSISKFIREHFPAITNYILSYARFLLFGAGIAWLVKRGVKAEDANRIAEDILKLLAVGIPLLGMHLATKKSNSGRALEKAVEDNKVVMTETAETPQRVKEVIAKAATKIGTLDDLKPPA